MAPGAAVLELEALGGGAVVLDRLARVEPHDGADGYRASRWPGIVSAPNGVTAAMEKRKAPRQPDARMPGPQDGSSLLSNQMGRVTSAAPMAMAGPGCGSYPTRSLLG